MVELLLVIAVIGVLAVVILIALNPLQQLARTRDAGRVSAVTQLGRAQEAYAVSRNGVYTAEAATWVDTLVTAGEVSTVPSAINYSVSGIAACSENAQNGYCYDATTGGGGGPIVVYARLESDSNNSKCSSGQIAWVVYSTAAGRGGVYCTAAGGNPNPGITTFVD